MAVSARGVAPSQLLAAIGLDPQALLDVDGRVPVEPALRAWQVAAELCRDPWFGLSVVEQFNLDYLGSLGLAIHGSATFGDALRRLARFFHLVNQYLTLELVGDGKLVRVRAVIDRDVEVDVEVLRHPLDCLLAALLRIGRRATGVALQPVAVAFRHAAPPELSAYLRAFGIAPSFGQPCCEIVFDQAALDTPHRAADSALTLITERHLRRLLDELPAAETFSGQARRVLLEELGRGEPTLSRLAERLRTSERTLQRRLGDEGTSVKALLDDARHQLSLRHLAESRESIAEISFLLGFAEVRAFHRAFRRWTGTTPAAYRAHRAIG